MKTFACFTIVANEATANTVIQLLSDFDIGGFEVTDNGFEFFIDQNHADYAPVVGLLQGLAHEGLLTYTEGRLEDKNWNELWEQSFEPLEIEGRVYVRADFHPEKPFEHTIVINPKMAFGTGHHATTQLMMQLQLELNHKQKTVVDCGCGTGILSILALRLGAATVTAFDISEWATNNTLENFTKNHCANYHVFTGTVADLLQKHSPTADIVLANIQRNVILSELPDYFKLLKSDGHLLVSGILSEAAHDIQSRATEVGFRVGKHLELNDWNAWLFEKP